MEVNIEEIESPMDTRLRIFIVNEKCYTTYYNLTIRDSYENEILYKCKSVSLTAKYIDEISNYLFNITKQVEEINYNNIETNRRVDIIENKMISILNSKNLKINVLPDLFIYSNNEMNKYVDKIKLNYEEFISLCNRKNYIRIYDTSLQLIALKCLYTKKNNKNIIELYNKKNYYDAIIDNCKLIEFNNYFSFLQKKSKSNGMNLVVLLNILDLIIETTVLPVISISS